MKPLSLYRENPSEFWRGCAFYCFWLSLAFFPIGYGFREVMPPLCLLLLLPYYKSSWPTTTLARLGRLRWLFYCAFSMIFIGVIFSIHPLSSLLHAGMGMNKAYILPFIAMECCKSLKDLTQLCWACVFACFWEGLDGVWQAATGFDFIMGYPYLQRLTGSLGDYTVGNYLALTLVPAFGCWYLLRDQFHSRIVVIFLFTAIFWPAVFLFIGASSRSGILAIAASLCLWGIIRRRRAHWLWLLLPLLAVTIFIIFEGYRFTPATVLEDNRWDLWRLAWLVFLAHPWFGAGAGQYNAAFQALHLAPIKEVITISHPHNLYLDILYAHGIIGAILGLIFLMGFLIWLLKSIWSHLHLIQPDNSLSLYWILTAWFVLGYFAWLINGIFGHDFYRIWWLAMPMTYLGIAIGAIINASAKTQ